MNNNLQCPVDFVPINEYKARITAFFVLTLMVVYLIAQLWVVLLLLAVDFLTRAANLGKYSVLGILSDAVIRLLKIKNKPVDRGPKRFAAWVGFVFLMGISILTALKLNFAANILIYVIIVFASLEAFVGFCAGCYVYTIGLLMLKNKG